MSRRLARRSAFKALFSIYYTNENDIDMFVNKTLDNDSLFWLDEKSYEKTLLDKVSENDKSFYIDLVKGTIDNRNNINSIIELYLKSWKMSRIAKVDLAIIQLAVFEMLYKEDIPISVSINEAVELGKEFGTDESGSFINGVLGEIARNHKINSKDDIWNTISLYVDMLEFHAFRR